MAQAKKAKKPAKVAAPEKRPIHIFICTPMYGGQCHGAYTQSLLGLNQVFTDGTKISYGFMFNESLIQRGRNALVQHARKTDFTHLMFIDSDIRFNPHDLKRMVEADVDVIGGIYPKKEINWETAIAAHQRGIPLDQLKHYTGAFVVNLVGYAPSMTVPIDKPAEVANLGTGFMLIKRHVFDKLEKKKLVQKYRNDVGDLNKNVGYGEEITEFFSCPIEEGTRRLLSEDYAFCQLVRKAGMKVWCAPWVKLAHVGSYIFEGHLIPDQPQVVQV